jgi:hypothetical protein
MNAAVTVIFGKTNGRTYSTCFKRRLVPTEIAEFQLLEKAAAFITVKRRSTAIKVMKAIYLFDVCYR